MELKAHRIDNIISAYKIGKAFCMKTEEEVYIKSEADKFFADKDKAFEYSQAVILVDIEIIKKQKIKRCLAMAKWCEATALWCFQAANTLPVGLHATLYGKPVMIEPKRLFKRFELLNKWNKRWLSYAEKIKKG